MLKTMRVLILAVATLFTASIFVSAGMRVAEAKPHHTKKPQTAAVAPQESVSAAGGDASASPDQGQSAAEYQKPHKKEKKYQTPLP
jgi:hypothetical protein